MTECLHLVMVGPEVPGADPERIKFACHRMPEVVARAIMSGRAAPEAGYATWVRRCAATAAERTLADNHLVMLGAFMARWRRRNWRVCWHMAA